MKLNVIITGATGMVGKGVLLECLDHEAVASVLCINRRSLNMQHPKLTECIHNDFSDFESIRSDLRGYNAAFLCMGVSAAGKSEEAYHHFTYDYTMALVRVVQEENDAMTGIYVSGRGTDSTGQGKIMWARVKGKTENAILNCGFEKAFVFRPGAIIPRKGIRSSTYWYQFIYDYLMWVIRFYKTVRPDSVVDTTQIGLAMIHASLKGYTTSHIESKDILALSE
ncbi:MAG: epimerase [Bacteroidota bacterium]